MAHKPARPFQQAVRIGKIGTAKETYINVSFEGVDVGKCCVSNTGSRVAVMQKLSNIVSTVAHNVKPVLLNCPQFARMYMHPLFDIRISLDRTGEMEELIHSRIALQ